MLIKTTNVHGTKIAEINAFEAFATFRYGTHNEWVDVFLDPEQAAALLPKLTEAVKGFRDRGLLPAEEERIVDGLRVDPAPVGPDLPF